MTRPTATRPPAGTVAPPGRVRLWVGGAVSAAGVVVLAYVAWQLVGTNVVSQGRQADLVDRFRTSESIDPGAVLDRDDAGHPLSASALVRIPRFGDDYVVPVVEGVDDEALASGFGHIDNGTAAGAVGNYALAGHRVTHGEPLRDMPSLRPGDRVVVETRGAVLTYVLDTRPQDLVVPMDAVWVLDQRPLNPDASGVQPARAPRLITLVTCAELFHTDERMVAFGHLVGQRPR